MGSCNSITTKISYKAPLFLPSVGSCLENWGQLLFPGEEAFTADRKVVASHPAHTVLVSGTLRNEQLACSLSQPTYIILYVESLLWPLSSMQQSLTNVESLLWSLASMQQSLTNVTVPSSARQNGWFFSSASTVNWGKKMHVICLLCKILPKSSPENHT